MLTVQEIVDKAEEYGLYCDHIENTFTFWDRKPEVDSLIAARGICDVRSRERAEIFLHGVAYGFHYCAKITMRDDAERGIYFTGGYNDL